MRISGNMQPNYNSNYPNQLNQQDHQALTHSINHLRNLFQNKDSKDDMLAYLDKQIGTIVNTWHDSNKINDSTFQAMNQQITNMQKGILNTNSTTFYNGLDKLQNILDNADNS